MKNIRHFDAESANPGRSHNNRGVRIARKDAEIIDLVGRKQKRYREERWTTAGSQNTHYNGLIFKGMLW